MSDFEKYAGDLQDLSLFEFDVPTRTGRATGGVYDSSDDTGNPTLLMVPGRDSDKSLVAANTRAESWGGGLGIWLSCLNASAFTGLEFSLRGETPTGDVFVSLNVESVPTAPFVEPVGIDDTWTTVQIPFADMMDSASVASDGSGITGLSITAVMIWVPDPDASDTWVLSPDGYEIQVDDIALY